MGVLGHRLCLREWKASEFAVFVSQLAAAGDAGLYDAEGLSRVSWTCG